ncbi:hypothetical protein CFC21_068905 [Triticum aestivum]|uniref:ELYS-like domain-containing protein n=2 Tax=Triticum aestivum TaxID=4565 RepID=A0A9R1HAH3_WHEAT|nr:uncharacterized protein LOC119304073 isoform X1 [Triticum dicoccoides]XP_037471455.1 uncharacterized protein LOC119345511 isoform X1 [Triticum dicoccoides]XP_044383998.1 uncharacterized protein LOC123105891 isoform X1 [Triticum aestivum]KAF7062283.1 hypothetical protein CFC21_068905 [Triticum aestivum]
MGDSVDVIPDWVGDLGESVGPVDYGCVRRCRHRRLATYLWLHGFRDALRGLLNETDAYMSVIHLSRLVQQGLWDDAVAYVSRFLRPTSHPQSNEAQVLLHFLMQHAAFASMVAGKPDRNLSYFNHKYNTRYLKHDDSVSFDCLRIRSIVLSILHSEQVRSSLDWERVRCKASQIVQHLAYKAPELKNVALLPGGPMMPHDVLPIGFRYRRRRHVKEQDLPGPKTLAKIYLRTKKGLPSSTRRHELNSGLTDKTRKWLIDLIDESLQAGLELQSSEKEKEGVPGATASHTMSNTLTDLTKNSVSGTSSLTNAGAHVAPVSQTMSGTLTVPANISGAPVAAVSQTVNLTSHAENSGISSVINAGTSKVVSSKISNLRKHQRTEEATFEHPKMQRTSGAFDEACLASVTKAGAGSRAGTVLELEGPKQEVEHR